MKIKMENALYLKTKAQYIYLPTTTLEIVERIDPSPVDPLILPGGPITPTMFPVRVKWLAKLFSRNTVPSYISCMLWVIEDIEKRATVYEDCYIGMQDEADLITVTDNTVLLVSDVILQRKTLKTMPSEIKQHYKSIRGN